VGDVPYIPKLQRLFTAWIAKGYNPRNLEAWLFEKYPNDDYYSNPHEKAVLDYLDDVDSARETVDELEF
jgi:hypothetical protein